MATTTTSSPSPAAKAPASRLGAVSRGRLAQALRFMFYGVEGLGKTTLAASAPDPIFFDLEDGSGHLDVARYPFRDGPGGHVARSFAEVQGGVRDLLHSQHAFKTLVIDTADRLEHLIWQSMLERDSGKQGPHNKNSRKLLSIEDYGYGKGYIMAVDEWRSLCNGFDALRSQRRMNVILLGHATIRLFKNPEGEDYDRYHLRVNEKAGGFLKEWADVTGFCCFEEGGGKLDPEQRAAKGFSTGRRMIKLERTAAYDAKSRIPLPTSVDLDPINPWGPLAEAVRLGQSMTPAELVKAIGFELERLGDAELTEKVRASVLATDGNVGTLSRYLNDLKRRMPAPPKEEGTHV